MLVDVWNFEYALLPCLAAYLVFDLPIIYRRLTRRLYVPVYFAFFPFGFSDELYARYFDEDHFYMVGGPYRKDQVSAARVKIIWVSVLSLALTMSVSPFSAALFSYFFLNADQQVQFFYTLGAVKFLLLTWSLYDLRWTYRVTDIVPFGYLILLYLAYWVALLTIFDRTLDWISAQHSTGGFKSLVEGLLDFLIFDIGVGIIFVSALGFLIPWRLTSGTAEPRRDESDIS